MVSAQDRSIAGREVPPALAEALWAADVGEPRHAELPGNAVGPPVVGPADVAAGRTDELGFPGDLGDAAKLGGDSVPVQRDEGIRRCRRRAGESEQGGCLVAPDTRCILPPAFAPCRPKCPPDGRHVQRPGGFHARLGKLRRCQPSRTVRRRPGRHRKLEPALSLPGPALGARDAPTLGIEDDDRGLGQVDRAAVNALDHDPLTTARADSTRGWRPLEQQRAVRAGGGDGSLPMPGRCRRRLPSRRAARARGAGLASRPWTWLERATLRFRRDRTPRVDSGVRRLGGVAHRPACDVRNGSPTVSGAEVRAQNVLTGPAPPRVIPSPRARWAWSCHDADQRRAPRLPAALGAQLPGLVHQADEVGRRRDHDGGAQPAAPRHSNRGDGVERRLGPAACG